MNLKSFIFKVEQDTPKDTIYAMSSDPVVDNLSKRLERVLRYYCEECDKGFTKVRSKAQHARFHTSNPFRK